MNSIFAKDGSELVSYTINNYNWTDMDKVGCRLLEEMKYIKSSYNCNTEPISFNNQVEWHKNDQWYNKKKEPQRINGGYFYRTILLADGTLLNFNCVGNMLIDVNGYKGPNTIGRDIFYIQISENKLIPEFFNLKGVNYCAGAYGVAITKDNYVDDCKNGSGYGCSPLFILE